MAEILIGAQIRAGSFTPDGETRRIAYNNLVLFTKQTFDPDDDSEYIGHRIVKDAYEAKIQNTPENIQKVFGKQITMTDLKKHLGKPVNIFLNRSKKVERVELLDTIRFDDLVADAQKLADVVAALAVLEAPQQ